MSRLYAKAKEYQYRSWNALSIFHVVAFANGMKMSPASVKSRKWLTTSKYQSKNSSSSKRTFGKMTIPLSRVCQLEKEVREMHKETLVFVTFVFLLGLYLK